MVDAKSLHGPSIDDLVWLQGLKGLPKLALWQLLYQVTQREGEVQIARQNVRQDSIAYRVTSEKLATLKQQRLAIWSSIYPKFNECIHVGVYNAHK